MNKPIESSICKCTGEIEIKDGDRLYICRHCHQITNRHGAGMYVGEMWSRIKKND